MTANELIVKLQKLVKENGNLDVGFDSPFSETPWSIDKVGIEQDLYDTSLNIIILRGET